jgi:hypothetical protein
MRCKTLANAAAVLFAAPAAPRCAPAKAGVPVAAQPRPSLLTAAPHQASAIMLLQPGSRAISTSIASIT